VAAECDATVAELRAWALAEHGIQVSYAGNWVMG
jgi:hypothetical protein